MALQGVAHRQRRGSAYSMVSKLCGKDKFSVVVDGRGGWVDDGFVDALRRGSVDFVGRKLAVEICWTSRI